MRVKSIFKKIPPLNWAINVLRDLYMTAGFISDYRAFRQLAGRGESRFDISWRNRYPCLSDKTAKTGFDRHYIYHPAWAARILAKRRPSFHVDISSSLHFCTLVSAFLPVRFYDYRPADICLDNLLSEHADICALPFTDGCLPSLSCMHVTEHIGLGRYGDPMDPDADLRAMSELKRVLAVGGDLLFVVPIGKPLVMFNAHRIYSYDQILAYFTELELMDFSLIPDDPRDGGLIENATREMADAQKYGCGCFWFRKNA